ncbi:MAG: DUF2240 family protein [Euryarchaeota archaeon]
MAHEDVQDVLRVLAICYREGSTLDALDLERVMSFDMDWLSPEEAEKSVQALIAAGWLTGPEKELTPTVALEGVTSPLGWFPRPSRLIKPCKPEKLQTSLTHPPDMEARSTPLPVTSGGPQPQPAVATPVESNDPRARLTPRLTKFIARQSQLPIEEVERRAKRKAKALTYASHWACLALVAREQGLVMDDITAALSVY